MSARSFLIILFSAICLGLIAYNSFAAAAQPVWQWGGLTTGADRYWTIATFLDAYCGFITFYVFVFYKERAWGRVGWFLAIMLLGNIAMAFYMLKSLWRLKPGQPVSGILVPKQ